MSFLLYGDVSMNCWMSGKQSRPSSDAIFEASDPGFAMNAQACLLATLILKFEKRSNLRLFDVSGNFLDEWQIV